MLRGKGTSEGREKVREQVAKRRAVEESDANIQTFTSYARTTRQLGWSAAETAAGCRIRDYGSGVPHWSPLYGGSKWRDEEAKAKVLRFKNFKTGEITDRPSHDVEGKDES